MEFQPGISGNPDGAPTKYKPEYNQQAFKLALLGATDAEMADFFQVHVDTIHEWKKVHVLFSDSVNDGKVKADSEVANKLYDRALGAKWTEQAAFKVRNQKESGVFTEEVVIVDLQKGAPPDTQAISLWLRNRKSSAWKDKTETDHTTGGQPFQFTPNIGALGNGATEDNV